MYKYKILKISQVIDSENEFISKNSEEKQKTHTTPAILKSSRKNQKNQEK